MATASSIDREVGPGVYPAQCFARAPVFALFSKWTRPRQSKPFSCRQNACTLVGCQNRKNAVSAKFIRDNSPVRLRVLAAMVGDGMKMKRWLNLRPSSTSAAWPSGSSLFSVECQFRAFTLVQSLILQSQRDWIIQPGVGPTPGGPTLGTGTTGFNPERVAYQRLAEEIQPFQGLGLFWLAPWVARSSQPWADRLNPFGIGSNRRHHPQTASGIPPKIAKNRLFPSNGRERNLRYSQRLSWRKNFTESSEEPSFCIFHSEWAGLRME